MSPGPGVMSWSWSSRQDQHLFSTLAGRQEAAQGQAGREQPAAPSGTECGFACGLGGEQGRGVCPQLHLPWHTCSDVRRGKRPGCCCLPDLCVGDSPKYDHEWSRLTLVTGGSAASRPRNCRVTSPLTRLRHLLAPPPAAQPGAHSLSLAAAPTALRPPAPPSFLCHRGRPGGPRHSDSRAGFEKKKAALKTQNTQQVSAQDQ